MPDYRENPEFEFKYSATPKLGRYFFEAERQQVQENNFKFKYSADAKFGRYYFYYDLATGKLRYIFKYWGFPKYGKYLFRYSSIGTVDIEDARITLTKEAIQIDESIYKTSLMDATQEIETYIEDLKRSLILSSTDFSILTPDEEEQLKYETVNEISLNDFVELLSQDEIAHGILEDSDIWAETNKTEALVLDSKTPMVKNGVEGSFGLESVERMDKIGFHADLEHTEKGTVSKTEFIAHLKKDIVFMNRINKLMEIKKDKLLKLVEDEATIHRATTIFRDKEYITNIEMPSFLAKQEHAGKIDTNQVSTVKLPKDTAVIQDNMLMNKLPFEFTLEDSTSNLGFTPVVKTNKDTQIDKSFDRVNRTEKDIGDLESLFPIVKGSKSIMVEDNENPIKKAGSNIMLPSKEVDINKDGRDIQGTSEKQVDKKGKEIRKENETPVSKRGKETIVEKPDLLSTEEKYIHQEMEERLNLHKRFWFLKSLGDKDMKVLPNRDFKYPATVEAFDEAEDGVYVYKYKDQFKDLGAFNVRMHKEDLSIIGQHQLMFIQDYENTFSDISIKIHVEDLAPEVIDYKYEVSFEIRVLREDVSYITIRQPKGFKGNEFVFTATEKFLAENHPIPLGEDLGIREIPVSIPIMVDFMNILLLLWSKRYLAFSGMMGTRAITGMTKLVHQWLTLDTSLGAESIDDYYRCYRWMRWEAEKCYNRAKLDPNLTGNLWIEEMIYEMIDYLEMHHFDKMPEWKDIGKMDEQRGIFNDPQLDIPIVLDKFKGVRKRAIDKNKRLGDY